eukprot:SM000041S15495  [mRNA]  locus=s41:471157:478198:+ [translate_table: standard]
MEAETGVGILCFASACAGFRGVLKQRSAHRSMANLQLQGLALKPPAVDETPRCGVEQRAATPSPAAAYSDFLVNEVALSGAVVRLTDLRAPPKEDDIDPAASKAKQAPCLDESEVIEAFSELTRPEDAAKLQKLLRSANKAHGGKAGSLHDEDNQAGEELDVIILAPDMDKAHRTEVHTFFKRNLPYLVSDTVDHNAATKSIRVRLWKGGSGAQGEDRRDRSKLDSRKQGRDRAGLRPRDPKRLRSDQDSLFDMRGKDDWPAEQKKYLMFHLLKQNKDTQDVLQVLARMLGLQLKSFGFAGTKDKRAVTVQQVTVYRQAAQKVAALNQRLFGIRVGNFKYVDEPLRLGQLAGNHFVITLRGVEADSDAVVERAAETLNKTGFINYFGLQRFGSGSVMTHEIGCALLRGDWQGAIDLILQPRSGDILVQNAYGFQRTALTNWATQVMASQAARQYYADTKDASGTLHQMPRQLVAERAVLSGMQRTPGNWVQILGAIPRTLRMMYVHSYQSYLWNHAASHRIQKYGCKSIVEGDLVLVQGDPAGIAELDEDQSSLHQGLGDAEGYVADEVDTEEETATGGVQKVSSVSLCLLYCLGRVEYVQVVSAEQAASGKFAVSDVVLPLPGAATVLPANDVADIYQSLAAKDGVSLTDSPHNVRDYSVQHLKGDYRRVLQMLPDLEWKLMKYTSVLEPLAQSDLARLDSHANGLPSPTSPELTPIPPGLDLQQDNGPEMAQDEHREAGAAELDAGRAGQPGAAGASDTPEQPAGLAAPLASEAAAGEAHAGTAVQLSFTLPPACYATMAIRELLKTSTSVRARTTARPD